MGKVGRVWSVLRCAVIMTGCIPGCAASGEPMQADPPGADDRVFDFYDGLDFDPAIPSPESSLGYSIGEHFTRHADVLDYLEALSDASDRVVMRDYGRTHQRRRLVLLTISSPRNLAHLDDILERNRELADPKTSDARVAAIIEEQPCIVWFSYNVHGNEASCTETAIQMAYTLAAGRNAEITRLLDELVIVIDPVLNPDGRERYVNWYQATRGASPLSNPDAAEHFEPWPGGRTNHYYFDLNRDWLWLIQPESQHRLEVYRQYLPLLHIDHHEQSYMQPFFLGAGDEPYNQNIPNESRVWIERYGDANAEAFDGRGRVYSTRERFDYLYPGYGKVLPVFHGAVGMLAEKGGHGRAGLAIDVGEIYTLTLRQRAGDHWLLGMSNLQFSAENRRGQLERFRRFFVESSDANQYDVAQYIVSADNDPTLLEKLWRLCDGHGIRIERTTAAITAHGLLSYRDGSEVEATIPKGSWIIRTAQPMGRLVNAIFERQTFVSDPETYDITSWSLPVSFGLDAYIAPEPVNVAVDVVDGYKAPAGIVTGNGDVALLVDARQFSFPMAIGSAMRLGLHGRISNELITLDDRTFGHGSLILHGVRNDPSSLRAFADELTALGLNVHRTATGMSQDGPVLGANANRRLMLPSVALLRGSPASSNSYGQVWHLLDHEAALPYTPINASDLEDVDLSAYNVIVVPDGSGVTQPGHGEALKDWVESGGTLVALAGGARWASQVVLELPVDDEANEEESDPPVNELTWEERRTRRIEGRIPGATVRGVVDVTHPLAAGLPEWIGVIKRGTEALPLGDEGYAVVRLDEDPRLGGLMPDREQARLARSSLMTHHAHGGGVVICIGEDVTFRGFQHTPMRLLLNSIIYGPSLPR